MHTLHFAAQMTTAGRYIFCSIEGRLLIILTYFKILLLYNVYFLLIISRVPLYRGVLKKKSIPFFSTIFHNEFMHQFQEESKESCQIYRQIKIFSQVNVLSARKRVQKFTVYLMKKRSKKQ